MEAGVFARRRLPGPDVVRAVAMLGVVMMNYHGYLIVRGGQSDGGTIYDLFDPWEGPLSTRFAALFVVTAGVGVTLLTRSAVGDPAATSDRTWLLVRRGLLLYGGGLLFDMVWPGSILPFYGAMFVLAAVLWRLRPAALAAVGVTAAIIGWVLHWWAFEEQLGGRDLSWLFDPGAGSPRGLLLDVFVNGTHPLLPWLAFLCAGMLMGRIIDNPGLLRVVGIAGALMWLIANSIALMRSGAVGDEILSPHPFDRSIVYTASALGSAMAVFVAVNELAERFADSAAIALLRRAGQLSLTIYLAHALVFNLFVDWLDLVTPGTLATSLTFTLVFWTVATAAAVAYQTRVGRGPAEWLYRRLSGSTTSRAAR